jgi:type VI secretion system protein
MPETRVLCYVVGVSVLAFACATPSRSARLRLQVSVAADANQDRPIPVDLVFVWDKKTAAKLDALTAKDWFDKKPQFRQEDPAERALAIREWEWVPGQAVPEIDMSVPAAARRWLEAIYVFANYRTEGPHRFRLSPGTANLSLLREDARVLKTDSTGKAPLTETRN